MTALVVLGVVDAVCTAAQAQAQTAASSSPLLNPFPQGLLTPVVISSQAASVEGTTGGLGKGGETYTLWELLHAMMLPSGNDAATALAEAIGPLCSPPPACASEGGGGGKGEAWKPPTPALHYSSAHWGRTHPVTRFVAEMNRTAQLLGMGRVGWVGEGEGGLGGKEGAAMFLNPTGLSHDAHWCTAMGVAALVSACMGHPGFRAIVGAKAFPRGGIKGGVGGGEEGGRNGRVSPPPVLTAPSLPPPLPPSIGVGGRLSLGTGGGGGNNSGRRTPPPPPQAVGTTAAAAGGAGGAGLAGGGGQWENLNTWLGREIKGAETVCGVKTGITPGAGGEKNFHLGQGGRVSLTIHDSPHPFPHTTHTFLFLNFLSLSLSLPDCSMPGFDDSPGEGLWECEPTRVWGPARMHEGWEGLEGGGGGGVFTGPCLPGAGAWEQGQAGEVFGHG